MPLVVVPWLAEPAPVEFPLAETLLAAWDAQGGAEAARAEAEATLDLVGSQEDRYWSGWQDGFCSSERTLTAVHGPVNERSHR